MAHERHESYVISILLPTDLHYRLWSSQRPPASIGVNFRRTIGFINVSNFKKAHLNFLKALARVNFSLQVDALAF